MRECPYFGLLYHSKSTIFLLYCRSHALSDLYWRLYRDFLRSLGSCFWVHDFYVS